jgi:hypothetical protein
MNRWAVIGRSFRCGLHSREGYRWLADLRGVRNSDRQRPGPRLLRQRLPEARAAARQQLAKHTAVAASLVFAAAARSTSWCHASAPPADRASAAPSAHPFSASKAQTKPFQSPSPRVVLRHQSARGASSGNQISNQSWSAQRSFRTPPHSAESELLLRLAGSPRRTILRVATRRSRSERVQDSCLSSARLVRCGRTDRGRTSPQRRG